MRMMTTRFTTVAALAALAVPGVAAAQAVAAAACEDGLVRVADLGISGLDCVGECSVTLDKAGRERRWRFSVEPRIMSIREGSVAQGRLRPGDRIVAVDGMLITTREAGVRYATLEAGNAVTIRVRRDGQVEDVQLRVGSTCADASALGRMGRVALPPVPPLAPDVVEPAVPAVAARVFREAVPTIARAPEAPTAPQPEMVPSSPRGRLGAGFQCGNCGSRTDEATGRSVWYFSGPVEVTNVEPAGPADRAGIQVGDLITAVEGQALDTEEGGAAFSALEPGEPVEITVVQRDGTERRVRVVPEERAPVTVVGRAVPRVPDVPAVAAAPSAPSGTASALPVSYVGSVAGVEVEVRGGPVHVSRYGEERVMVIEAGGVQVRIRVPAKEEGGR